MNSPLTSHLLTGLRRLRWLAAVAVLLLFRAAPALATQTHGEGEGLVVHQIAHLFFVFSMGTLIYWLRARKLPGENGWRLIRYAAFFLILWNLDAFAAHFLDEQGGLIRMVRRGWDIHIESAPGYEMLAPVYYLAKLDHLLCVPALVLLLRGLLRLTEDVGRSPDQGDPS